MNTFHNIDNYIKQFPKEKQKRLNEIRNFVRNLLPEAEEKIWYGMPCFYQNGIILCYAAFKKHYGIFPGGAVLNNFDKELCKWRTGKGTLRFSLEEQFPFTLLQKIIEFNLNKNKLNKS